jgi:hypothetical protein
MIIQYMLSDLFVITSVINTGNNPWSYTPIRSCFTKEERFDQTLQTIESIRKLNDNSKIILAECSDLDDHMTSILKTKVEYYIQMYNNIDIRNACLNNNMKGLGEVIKLQYICTFIKDNNIKFNRLFKISGRYYLNTSFSKDFFSNHVFTFNIYSPDSGSTVLYSVPYSKIDIYLEKLIECSNHYMEYGPEGLEKLLPFKCIPRNEIITLGVSGQVAVVNDKGESDFYTA